MNVGMRKTKAKDHQGVIFLFLTRTERSKRTPAHATASGCSPSSPLAPQLRLVEQPSIISSWIFNLHRRFSSDLFQSNYFKFKSIIFSADISKKNVHPYFFSIILIFICNASNSSINILNAYGSLILSFLTCF